MPGRPRRRGLTTRVERSGAAAPEVWPWVRTTRSPVTTPAVPSVMTRGGMRSSVTPSPFASPTAAPMAITPSVAGRSIAFTGHDVACDQRRQRHDGSDGQVDALLTADDDEGLAGGYHGEDRGDGELADELAA